MKRLAKTLKANNFDKKQKKNHFYDVKQRNKHINNNIKNNGAKKS